MCKKLSSGIRFWDEHFVCISESLETIFGVNILKFFDADADPDPGFGNLFDPGRKTVLTLPVLIQQRRLYISLLVPPWGRVYNKERLLL
jgi:hypothetical protein